MQPGWCACTGPGKPGAVPTSGRIPPAYLAHGTSDPMVSVQYTCALYDRMHAAGAVTLIALRDGDGHVLPATFASDAWAFLSTQRLR
jgi:predicted esterase